MSDKTSMQERARKWFMRRTATDKVDLNQYGAEIRIMTEFATAEVEAAVLAEREACASIGDNWVFTADMSDRTHSAIETTAAYQRAIRARAPKPPTCFKHGNDQATCPQCEDIRQRYPDPPTVDGK